MAVKLKHISRIKQLLRLHNEGYSIKGIARNLSGNSCRLI